MGTEKPQQGADGGDAASHRVVTLTLQTCCAEGATNSSAKKQRGPPGKKIQRSAAEEGCEGTRMAQPSATGALVVTTGWAVVDDGGRVVRTPPVPRQCHILRSSILLKRVAVLIVGWID